MRTTIALDDDLVAKAQDHTGITEKTALFGTGIGYVDAHLLASTMLMPGTTLWTRDTRLTAAAQSLGIAAHLPS
ncbi:type II toxin-antitoxin system VapB family antitoxin [Sphingomonas sp. SUN019]|uniref:type II toxin-antitoxin system VapB family antitoxin n=1 Tax=Sphingomonas sp. SUN019 TaxID=2937788 RepID=UPI00216480EE|nr:type II toxin-antitoxin system VapB family antitoxin [Sphingomonas sp. SUN019]UVO50251.1 type II toxin-antitoxin system VapB family antitoxin [Sphingomonas sp. SUN019]